MLRKSVTKCLCFFGQSRIVKSIGRLAIFLWKRLCSKSVIKGLCFSGQSYCSVCHENPLYALLELVQICWSLHISVLTCTDPFKLAQICLNLHSRYTFFLMHHGCCLQLIFRGDQNKSFEDITPLTFSNSN